MGKELFKNIPSKVGDLVKDVRNGRIGLPDLQRPFVWKDNKVRELFDSMLKGYPIGYIMLWESPSDYESKKSTIGQNAKTYEEPKELVIDGQQRLTALVAAMFAVKVKDKNFADREIKISYNPLTREFVHIPTFLEHINMYDNFNRVVRFLNIKQESGIEITFCSFLLRMDNNS